MEITNVREIAGSKFLRFYEATYIDTEDEERKWTFVSRNEIPIIQSGEHNPCAVVIAALHEDGLVLTEEFRVPINNFEIGFPAGLIDSDESADTAAARELFEETGLKVTEILKVSPPIYSSIGMTDESVILVYCKCEGEPNTESTEASEEIDVSLMTQDEVKDILYDEKRFFGAKAWPIMERFSETGEI